MAKKSMKQEFLDKENKTPFEKIVENMLVNYTRTKIATLGRSMREVERVAYTTTQKELPFNIMLGAVEQAYKLAMSEKEENANI